MLLPSKEGYSTLYLVVAPLLNTFAASDCESHSGGTKRDRSASGCGSHSGGTEVPVEARMSGCANGLPTTCWTPDLMTQCVNLGITALLPGLVPLSAHHV